MLDRHYSHRIASIDTQQQYISSRRASDLLLFVPMMIPMSMSIPGWGYMLVQPLLLDAKDE